MSPEPPSVLFVCKSNAGKSQMAEALMRQLVGDAVSAHSAGTAPKQQVNAESAAALEEVGADMASALPKPVDAELMRTADRVIVLGAEAQPAPVPDMRTAIERWEIAEPSTQGIAGMPRMRLIRDEITENVARLAMELTGQVPGNAAVYRGIEDDLTELYQGVVVEREVVAAVRAAHAALIPSTRLTEFLPIRVERFAKELIAARAAAEGRRISVHPKLLFVCVHNAGRSQIAAALAHHLSGGRVNVRSAGSSPMAEVDPMVLQVLRERGIQVADVYPKPLNDDVLRAADVVVTMGCGDACPVLPGKRYEDWDVEDPVGADLQKVRRVVDDIQHRITDLLAAVLDRDLEDA